MLKRWVAYYLFLLATLVFALLYPGQVSSAFFYTVLSLPPLSLCVALIMLAGFRFEQRIDRDTAAKGDTVTYWLVLKNKCPLLLPCVEADFYRDSPAFAEEFLPRRMAVAPLANGSMELRLPCRYKGVYEIGLRQIRLRDYLGLFVFKQNVTAVCSLTVYPRIVPVNSFPLASGYIGEFQRPAERSRDITDNSSDIRKYSSGDHLRTVHWKLTAKRDELMVRNYEQTSGATADIILDGSGLECGQWEAVILEDRLVESAVSLAWHFASRSVPSTVYYNDGITEKHMIHSSKDFHTVYRLFSEARIGINPCLPTMDAAGDGSNRKTVVIVAYVLTEALCCHALGLKAFGCMVVFLVVAGQASDAAVEREASLTQAGVRVISIGSEEDIGAALAREAV